MWLLGPRTLWVDCDVLQADGGTRTAAITGACVAVELALSSSDRDQKTGGLPHEAACGCGERRDSSTGQALLDLNYIEDKAASVDLNLVMTDALDFVEVQGSGEEAVFSQAQLSEMLDLGKSGIEKLLQIQSSIL